MNEKLIAAGCLLIAFGLIAGALQFAFWLWPASEAVPAQGSGFVCDIINPLLKPQSEAMAVQWDAGVGAGC